MDNLTISEHFFQRQETYRPVVQGSWLYEPVCFLVHMGLVYLQIQARRNLPPEAAEPFWNRKQWKMSIRFFQNLSHDYHHSFVRNKPNNTLISRSLLTWRQYLLVIVVWLDCWLYSNDPEMVFTKKIWLRHLSKDINSVGHAKINQDKATNGKFSWRRQYSNSNFTKWEMFSQASQSSKA